LVVLQRVLRIILVILPEHPSDTYVFTMKMEILLESTSNKLMVEGHKNYFVSDLLIDFQIKFSLSIGEIVTHWFTLIVLSALRRSGNENMLGLVILILRSILTDLQETSKESGGRYEHASPVSLKAQDDGDHIMMNRDYAWPRWCTWICGIFSSNMASILVNGSPTAKFTICCGLKQGDPLAPLLFILVMESLHIFVSRDVNNGVFKGVMVGDHMSRYTVWSNSIQKVRARLTKWKVKTLSVGGRLTLLKSVLGAVPIYNMSIYKAPISVLHKMEMFRNKFFNGGDSQKEASNEEAPHFTATDASMSFSKAKIRGNQALRGMSNIHVSNQNLVFSPSPI
nr:RNA-directed DNA polymerase, eukaryota [Tanacetum cinerariifolium]